MDRLERFFAALPGAPARLLMLDYDGTLAPFRDRREEATPYPGVPERVDAIARNGRTRVVMVAGRPTDEVKRLLAVAAELEIWGCHGYERRHPDGRLEHARTSAESVAALRQARAWAEEHGLADRLEHKPAGMALHWRGAPEKLVRQWSKEVSAAWQRLAGTALELHAFDGGLELRPPRVNKGLAVTILLSELPTGAAAAYLGDDFTDEHAFQALAAWRERQEGATAQRLLSVLVRESQRPTAADTWLKPPEELLAFLDRWVSG